MDLSVYVSPTFCSVANLPANIRKPVPFREIIGPSPIVKSHIKNCRSTCKRCHPKVDAYHKAQYSRVCAIERHTQIRLKDPSKPSANSFMKPPLTHREARCKQDLLHQLNSQHNWSFERYATPLKDYSSTKASVSPSNSFIMMKKSKEFRKMTRDVTPYKPTKILYNNY